MNIIKTYWKSLIRDNKLPTFINILLGMKNPQSIGKSFIYRFLKSIYGLK